MGGGPDLGYSMEYRGDPLHFWWAAVIVFLLG